MRNNTVSTSFGNFSEKTLLSGNCYLKNSLTGEELSIDTLTATVDNSTNVPTRFMPKGASGMLTVEKELYGVRPYQRVQIGDLSQYKYGEPVLYYHGGKLIGKFFLSSIDRKTRYTYQLSCISAIGLLDNSKHYGGIYNRVRLDAIVEEIVSGTIEYVMDEELAGILVTGWLPIDSKRNNLHQVLFPMGVSVKKEENGMTRFTYYDGANKLQIEENRIFVGGSIEYQSPATKVIVTEHSYLNTPNDETVNLYNGNVIAVDLISPKGQAFTGQMFQFEDPVHNLSITGGTILERGVNYSIVGPASNCTLTGRKYTHALNEISRGVDNTESAESTISVTDCTMINATNSDNVARRLLSYYSAAKLVNADLVVENERPGIGVKFTDPFDDQVDGFIESMNLNFGGFLRANTSFADKFVPVNPGNAFTRYVVLRGNGTWIAPSDVKRIRVAMIAGGTGGIPGEKGEDGKEGTTGTYSASDSATRTNGVKQYYGRPGSGGSGGDGSIGGKIYDIILDFETGQQFSYTSGTGGTSAASGSASTFGTYSSDSGAPFMYGYTNQVDGSVYATPGTKGLPGGRGSGSMGEDDKSDPSIGETIIINGVSYKPGGQGENDENSYSYNNGGQYNDRTQYQGYGGVGGGAAAGKDGNRGGNGSGTASRGLANGIAGRGGTGATATLIPEKSIVLGGGGTGGYGGGGGGSHGVSSAGLRRQNDSTGPYAKYTTEIAGVGLGGDGGPGGQGGDGGIIVFY